MINWEEIIKTESADELKKVKVWLFKENMRLSNERSEFEQSRDKFLKERVKLRDELDELNRRTVLERKRLKEENLFFEKKMAILQDGFRQLEEDRKKFERERRMMMQELQLTKEDNEATAAAAGSSNLVELLFRSVSNPLALRKRYRDLVKIFHPDNMFGDAELAQMINKEYLRRKRDDS